MQRFRRPRGRGRPPHPDVLTPAEWRVLEHLREGRPNAEIAERLGLSVNTVRTHVSSMLAKLGLRSRSELANWSGSPSAASRSALRRAPAALLFAGKAAAVAGALGAIVVVIAFAAVNARRDGEGQVAATPTSTPDASASAEPPPVDETNATVLTDGLELYTGPNDLVLGTLTSGSRIVALGQFEVALPQPTTWLGLEGLGWVLYDPQALALDEALSALAPIEPDDPRAAAPLYPDTQRTGIDAVDRIVQAVLAMDQEAIASLIDVREQPCTVASEDFIPWTCPEGVEPGTLVAKFDIGACGGERALAEDRARYVAALFAPQHEGYIPSDAAELAPLHLYAVFERDSDVGGYEAFFAYAPGSISRSLTITPAGTISSLQYGCGDPAGRSVPLDQTPILRPRTPAQLVPDSP